jgi:hypothetical protein
MATHLQTNEGQKQVGHLVKFVHSNRILQCLSCRTQHWYMDKAKQQDVWKLCMSFVTPFGSKSFRALYKYLELTFVCIVEIVVLGQILYFSLFFASDAELWHQLVWPPYLQLRLTLMLIVLSHASAVLSFLSLCWRSSLSSLSSLYYHQRTEWYPIIGKWCIVRTCTHGHLQTEH